ncbi:hypothetical protein SAMN04487996_12370 [Dyadobacter soli]|uniref:Uncharacterized protein n=1 Tax=Dyadobacter soli TaxID=659014 RepID=A0A1G7X710_9BACT|nr:hypothetical protein SAMN04487996_12370 [Dyadobacter soli]
MNNDSEQHTLNSQTLNSKLIDSKLINSKTSNSSTYKGDRIPQRLVGTLSFRADDQESMETCKMSLYN